MEWFNIFNLLSILQKKFFVRYKLGTGWEQPKTCQHPKHSLQKKNKTVQTVPLKTLQSFNEKNYVKLPIRTVFCSQHLKGETPPIQKKKVDNKESDSKKNEDDILPEDQEVDIQIDPEYEPEEVSVTDDSILEKSNESSKLLPEYLETSPMMFHSSETQACDRIEFLNKKLLSKKIQKSQTINKRIRKRTRKRNF